MKWKGLKRPYCANYPLNHLTRQLQSKHRENNTKLCNMKCTHLHWSLHQWLPPTIYMDLDFLKSRVHSFTASVKVINIKILPRIERLCQKSHYSWVNSAKYFNIIEQNITQNLYTLLMSIIFIFFTKFNSYCTRNRSGTIPVWLRHRQRFEE